MTCRSSFPRRTLTPPVSERQSHRQPELHDRGGRRGAGADPRPRGLASVDLASYQAVSGAGRKGLDAFEAERGTDHRDRADESPFHGRIADSVVPQIDVLDETGWSGEEKKIHAELRKILEMPTSTWPPPPSGCPSTPATPSPSISALSAT